LNRLKKKRRKKKKFSKKNKSLMSTWEDSESSNYDSKEEANIGFMADVVDNSMSDDSYNKIDFTDIDSLCLSYQEEISNNGIIASTYKIMKRNFKNSCKELNYCNKRKLV